MTPRQPSDEKANQILAAARRVLGAKGYARATISQVAAEAGVSRGLLHYYFKSKEEMLAKVMGQTVGVAAQMAAGLFAQAESAEQLAENICLMARRFVEIDPDFAGIFFESWGLARQSGLVDRELKAMYQQFVSSIQQGLEAAASRGAIPAPRDPEATAVLLTALIDGLSLQMMSMPHIAKKPAVWDLAQRAIRLILSGG